MSFFDQVYQRLFPQKNGEKRTLTHEVIHRNDNFKSGYESWTKSYKSTDLIYAVRNSYQMKQAGVIATPDVHILKSPYSNGFAISFSDAFQESEFHYLFDWLAERVESLDYQKTNSDLLITDKDTHVEWKEKHYLKPIHSDTAPINQQFGNILVEFIKINDRPSYLRLSAMVYSDRLYQEPKPFEELADFLLTKL